MKLFDGVNKYTYQTIFGKIQLFQCDEGIIFKFHDEVNVPNLRLIASARMWQMRFDTRVSALKKLLLLEKNAITDLKKIIEEEI